MARLIPPLILTGLTVALAAIPPVSAADVESTITILPLKVVGGAFDVSALNAARDFAVGTCKAKSLESPNYILKCGVDRDDDGRVSRLDTGSSDPDGYDDDYARAVSADNGEVALSVCLRRDRSTVSGVLDGPAGGDWDDVAAFVEPAGVGVPPPTMVQVTLTLTASTGCGTGINVSEHAHAGYCA